MVKKSLRHAALYIDGNNWFHSLKEAGVVDLMQLDYTKISKKLVGARDWVTTTYYIGQIKQQGNSQLYRDQRRFLTQLQKQDSRIKVCLGRIEGHPERNQCAEELLNYVHKMPQRIDPRIFHDLVELGKQHKITYVMAEKAVDVHLAVDLVMHAQAGKYDDAYILSCDGDFTPAVEAVKSLGKRVFAASPGTGAELAAVVDTFIPLKSGWFIDCYT